VLYRRYYEHKADDVQSLVRPVITLLRPRSIAIGLVLALVVLWGCSRPPEPPVPEKRVMKFAPIMHTARMELRISAPIATHGLTRVNERVFSFMDETFHWRRRVFIQSDSLMRISAACVVYRDGDRQVHKPSFRSHAAGLEGRIGPASQVETTLLSSGSLDTTAVVWIDSGLALQLRKTEAFAGYTHSISLIREMDYDDWCNRLVDG
jgi:hypothetical protein